LFYDRLIEDYAERPRTVILSTHLIDEVSRLLEHIIVIDNGRIIIDEDAEALRGKAYTIAGTTNVVEKFTTGKTVIHRESFGALLSATVLGNKNESDRKQAEALGLEFASVSLQQLIVYMTSNKSDRKEAKAL
jgi:ABC-2 type transport system ATP-binding protein